MESIRNWTARDAAGFGARVVVLALAWYGLWRVPQDGVGSLLDSGAGIWFAVVVMNTLVVAYVVARSRWTGAKLVGAVALLYGTLQTVSFLEIYLYEMVSLEEALWGAFVSVVTILVVATLVVAAFGKLTGEDAPPSDGRLRLSPRQWAWKVPLIALVHLATFLAAGLFVFVGVAELVDPVAYAEYEILDPPSWIFPFQALRGVVFAAAMLPVVYLLRGGVREAQGTVALAFAVLLSSGLLLPDSGIPGRLWVAHFAEVFGSSLVLGVVVVALAFRAHHPLRWVRNRLGGASGESSAAS